MKKLKNIFLIFIASQLLISCALTRGMWSDSRVGGGKIEGFFIDRERGRVVLVGAKNPETNLGMNYSITEPTGKILKIFELGQKAVGVSASFNGHQIESKGKEIFGNAIGILINKKNLSKDQIQELYDLDLYDLKNLYSKELLNSQFLEKSRKDLMLYSNENYGHIMIGQFQLKPLATRYPSSQEQVKNFCKPSTNPNQTQDCVQITKFTQPWQGVIWNRFTPSDKAIRVAATPFTVALDILLTPLYIIGVFGMGVGSK